MTGLAFGALPRLLAPLLSGTAVGVVVQVTEPETRLYATVSPGLLAGLAGLLGTVILVAGTLASQSEAG